MYEPTGIQHIDVHHHIIPDFYRRTAREHGLSRYADTLLPEWSPAQLVDMLDAQAIQTAVVSLPPPGVCFVGQDKVSAFARRCNDYTAELVRRYPGRVGGFGALPLTDLDGTLSEVDHIFDTLGLDGVALYSNIDGRYPGDPGNAQLFAELNRRAAVAYLHPALGPHAPAPGQGPILPTWCGEFVFDTTRALADLVLRGTLEHNPRFTLIVAHAGGTTPYILNRLTNAWRELPEAQRLAPAGPAAYLRRVYYDTASCGAGHGLRLVRDLFGADQILVGSDFPFVPTNSITSLARNLRDPQFLGVSAAVLRANALRALPRYALPGELHEVGGGPR